MANNESTLVTIGNNIRDRRLKLRLSQNQLAFEAGVTREFVNKVERGNHNVSVKTLEKIAIILDVKLWELFV